jgi:catechol 2,3-dioxygenase-like lactoylglutathione lyase family enzyme
MIVELNHVNIATDDVEGSRLFYERVLGLTAGYRPDFDFDGAWLYAGARALIHLQAPSPYGTAVGALSHAAFEVEDFDAAKARLAETGVGFRESTPPDRRNRQLFFRDTNGVTIELIAPVKVAAPA